MTQGEYVSAILGRIGDLKTQHPEPPVVCVRKNLDGSQLAVARFDPRKTSQESIVSAAMDVISKTIEQNMQWESVRLPITAGHLAKDFILGGLITAAAQGVTSLITAHTLNIHPMIFAALIGAIGISTFSYFELKKDQKRAAKEMITKLALYAPQAKILQAQAEADCEKGVAAIARPLETTGDGQR